MGWVKWYSIERLGSRHNKDLWRERSLDMRRSGHSQLKASAPLRRLNLHTTGPNANKKKADDKPQ